MVPKSGNRFSDQDHAPAQISRVDIETTFKVQNLLARYIQALDDDRLEDWPNFFTDTCRYVVTTADNLAQGMPLGMIYATSRAMLRDRVRSLRDANVYEAQRYRHMIAPPVIEPGEGGIVQAKTSFMVVRIMHTGETMIFVTGRYDDRILLEGPDAPRFAEKTVVLDSRVIDTLLAIPI
jgi:3-phenylpropionate/cinnamic acid dioxygenase small subunit